jgi:hypothetical protein
MRSALEKREPGRERGKKKKKKALPDKKTKGTNFVDELFSTIRVKSAKEDMKPLEKVSAVEASPVRENGKGAKKRRQKWPSSSWLDEELDGRKRTEELLSCDGIVGRTAEGWPIYREEELVSTSSGDTKACPFDCACCY